MFWVLENLLIDIPAAELCEVKQFNPFFIKRNFHKILGNVGKHIQCSRMIPVPVISQAIPGFKYIMVRNISNLRISAIGDVVYTGKCENTKTNVSIVYLGWLNRKFYPIRNLRINNPHIVLVKRPEGLSIAALGTLYFCKHHAKCKPNAIVYYDENSKKTILNVDKHFHFKPSWIDPNFMAVQRFNSSTIHDISRFNINYFTDLVLGNKAKLRSTTSNGERYNTVHVVSDTNSTFRTHYSGDVEHYTNVQTEMFMSSQNFLGVFLKMAKMKLMHLVKIVVPQDLHFVLFPDPMAPWGKDLITPWSEIIQYVNVS